MRRKKLLAKHASSQKLVEDMNSVPTIHLNPTEMAIACELWSDLKYGLADAEARLKEAPENVREAVMQALVAGFDMQMKLRNS